MRRWTILVVPQDVGKTRELQVSARALKVLSGTGIVLVGALLALMVTAVSKAVDLGRLDRIEKRNEILAQELARMTRVVGVLNDTVTAITERDQRVRLLAGLSPSNPDILQAGIGGPASPRSAADLLLAETTLGQQALSTRFDLETLIRRAQMLGSSYQQAVDTLGQRTDRFRRIPSIRPTDGFVSSRFSRNRVHPIFNEERPHTGADFVAPKGAAIFATASGRVVDVVNVPRNTGYGMMVLIDHGDGIRTRYAHASKILVRVGQQVSRGDKIAEVGDTGWATNHHVHYEVIVNGVAVDPMTFVFNDRIVD